MSNFEKALLQTCVFVKTVAGPAAISVHMDGTFWEVLNRLNVNVWSNQTVLLVFFLGFTPDSGSEISSSECTSVGFVAP